MRLAAVLLLPAFAAVLSRPAAAQTPSHHDGIRAFAALELAGRAPEPRAERRAVPHELLAQRRSQPGTVYLIVGGAVAVAGILVEEDILIIGGVVVAGYGLYLNVR